MKHDTTDRSDTGRSDTPIYDAVLEELQFDLAAVRTRPRWDIAAARARVAGGEATGDDPRPASTQASARRSRHEAAGTVQADPPSDGRRAGPRPALAESPGP